MKFTSEDLMKAMGLNVGDKVRVDTFDNSDFEVREAYDMGHKEIVLVDDNEEMFSLTLAFGYEYEILPRPKRVGDLKCGDIIDRKKCSNCSLKMIDCVDNYGDEMINKTLYEILDYQYRNYQDQEIYDLLKARLDKEVVEE